MNDETKEKMDKIIEKTKVVANQAGKKAGEIAAVVGEKAEELWDATKKRVAIEKLEYKIGKTYRNLGKSYFDAVKDGGTFTDSGFVAEIKSLYEAIDAVKADKPVDIDLEDIDEDEDK